MFKIKALVVSGIALFVEGYFQIVRGIMPLDFFNQSSDAVVYYKVVGAQEGANEDIVFYVLSVLLLVIAVFLLCRVKVKVHYT